MSANSSIEWTDRTWNPTRGCSVISPGCVNCYAMKQAHRFSGPGKAYEGLTKLTTAGPQWTGQLRTVESALLEPLSWRTPQRVFVNSMSDLFHEGVPDQFIDKVFAVMTLAERHTFQILTKRADRLRAYFAIDPDTLCDRWASASMEQELPLDDLARDGIRGGADRDEQETASAERQWSYVRNAEWPLRNVWLGVSVEDQKHADERIPLLLQTPAAVRFISAEPLLGSVDLKSEWLGGVECCIACDRPKYPVRQEAGVEVRQGWPGCINEACVAYGEQNASGSCRRMLDWVIVGGESGPGARPFDLAWARSLVQQCQSASVPVFMKQVGGGLVVDTNAPETPRSWTVSAERAGFGKRGHLVLHDRKGGNPDEWPEDLRVRQFPEVRA